MLPSGFGPWIPALPTMVCLDPIPWVKITPTRFTHSFGESILITLRGGLQLGIACWGQQLAAVGRSGRSHGSCVLRRESFELVDSFLDCELITEAGFRTLLFCF